MAKHITEWQPDTCGCILTYSWDDETSEDDRVHEPYQIGMLCKDHSQLDPQDVKGHHAVILEENQRKNFSYGALKKSHPEADISWSFDKDRNVIFNVSGAKFLDKLLKPVPNDDKVIVNFE